MRTRASKRGGKNPRALRFYRALLWLYPRSFRNRFGEELTAAMRGDLERLPASRRDRLSFWWHIGVDLAFSSYRLHAQRTIEDFRAARADLSAAIRLVFRPAVTAGFAPPFPSLLGGLLMSASRIQPTANDRFKQSFSTTLWSSVMIATLTHFALLNFFPELEAEVNRAPGEVAPVNVEITVPLPEPPTPIRRPQAPMISAFIEDLDVTIAKNVGLDPYVPIYQTPKIPGADPSTSPGFTPYDLAPSIRNRDEVTRALAREYPPLLRDAGIGDTVLVWLHIDEHGEVQRFQVQSPSVHEPLNQAALRVVGVAEFSAAMNRDKPVAVWVEFPVIFQVR